MQVRISQYFDFFVPLKKEILSEENEGIGSNKLKRSTYQKVASTTRAKTSSTPQNNKPNYPQLPGPQKIKDTKNNNRRANPAIPTPVSQMINTHPITDTYMYNTDFRKINYTQINNIVLQTRSISNY